MLCNDGKLEQFTFGRVTGLVVGVQFVFSILNPCDKRILLELIPLLGSILCTLGLISHPMLNLGLWMEVG